MYGRLNGVGVLGQVTATHHCTAVVTLHRQVGTTARAISCLSCWYSNFDDRHTIYIIIIIIIILYLSAHVQRPKQALGIAPHEALFKKNKHTQKVYWDTTKNCWPSHKALLPHLSDLHNLIYIYSSKHHLTMDLAFSSMSPLCLCICLCVDSVNTCTPVGLCLSISSQEFNLSCYVLTCPLSPPCVGAGQTCGQTSSQAGAQGSTCVWCSARKYQVSNEATSGVLTLLSANDGKRNWHVNARKYVNFQTLSLAPPQTGIIKAPRHTVNICHGDIYVDIWLLRHYRNCYIHVHHR